MGGDDLSPTSVSYTAGFYHIPVIGISARQSAFSDKNLNPSFLRTVPPYSFQADAWLEIIKEFNWHTVVFIHSADQEGRAILGRFQELSTTKLSAKNKDKKTYKIETSKIIEYLPEQSNYTEDLKVLQDMQERVILLYADA